MLSPNQVFLLDALSTSTPTYLHEIADWHVNGASHDFGEDAARNAMKRLELRDLVAGDGTGRERGFLLTEAGRSALREAQGLPEPHEPESAVRDYIVLERINLEDLDVAELDEILNRAEAIYVQVSTVEARNTEHALRLAAGEYSERVEIDVTPTLIPVATRMWQPKKVTIRRHPTVSIA